MAEVADKPSATEQGEKMEKPEENSTKTEDKPATNGNATSEQTEASQLEKKIIHQVEVTGLNLNSILVSRCSNHAPALQC